MTGSGKCAVRCGVTELTQRGQSRLLLAKRVLMQHLIHLQHKNLCNAAGFPEPAIQSQFLKRFVQFLQFAVAHAYRLSWVRKGPRAHF